MQREIVVEQFQRFEMMDKRGHIRWRLGPDWAPKSEVVAAASGASGVGVSRGADVARTKI